MDSLIYRLYIYIIKVFDGNLCLKYIFCFGHTFIGRSGEDHTSQELKQESGARLKSKARKKMKKLIHHVLFLVVTMLSIHLMVKSVGITDPEHLKKT